MTEPLLRIRGVGKSFAGVRALDDVSFDVAAGEICTVAGENGAGKSTLLAVIGGSVVPDQGDMVIDGTRREEHTPRRALADGVLVAHQEPAVVPQLSVRQNLFLGRSRAQRKAAGDDAAQALADMAGMGFPVEPNRLVRDLSPAERHALTIARAFVFGARIVALDEPTTSMLEHNVEEVLSRVREIAHGRGVGVLYVSHKMPEVVSVSDSVVVLRDGRVVFRGRMADTDEQEIVRMMVGRRLLAYERAGRPRSDAPVVLSVRDARHPKGTGPISLDVRAGEVVGIAGLVGSGRTEFLRSVVHADPGSRARVSVREKPVRIGSPRDSRDAGVAFIPEDRKRQGLVLQIPAFKNVALTAAGEFRTLGALVSGRREIIAAQDVGGRMSLRPANVRLDARQFSGGNQQKLVLAKWVRRDAQVYLFDEPTKGVDVGGKVEIYALIDQLAAAGKAVVVVSSDLPEIIAISDRVEVMRGGRLVATHTGADINEHSLVASAMGTSEEAT
jgi:ribose transport system ATP-binding protein